MPRIALSDLITPSTSDELMQTFIDGLVALGLTSAATWPKGGTARSVVRVFAAMAAGFSRFNALIARAAFRDLATGDWLTLWARSVYNVERPLASFAGGDVTLTNAGVATYSFPIGGITAKNSATGKTYVNTAALVGLVPSSSQTIAFQAIEQGAASSAAPDAVDTLVTTMLGVTITNVQAFVGRDQATDDELATLCLAKLGSWSPNGAEKAYEFVSLADPTTIPALVRLGLTTQTSVPITRAKGVSDGAGGVNVYLATAAGPASGPDVTIVDARLQAVPRPLGIKVTTAPAVPVTVPVSYEAWLKSSSLDTAGALLAFANALTITFAGFPMGGIILPPATGPNGTLEPNELEGALFGGTPGVRKAVVSAPAAPVTLTPSQVPVLGAITPTVHIL